MLLEKEIKEICKDIMDDKEVGNFSKKSIISKFKRAWINIMALGRLYNDMYKTYSLNDIQLKPYGIKARIYIVPPLTYDKLNDNRTMIEENLNCCIIFNHNKASKWIEVKFVYNQNSTKSFRVIKESSPYKLYICDDYSGKPIFADLKKYPHLLVTGTTRSGKSKLADCSLTNLIYNCTKEDLQLYLIQVAKSDLILYKNCEQSMAFCDTLEKTRSVLEYIVNVVLVERTNAIKHYREKAILDNIYELNELKKGQQKFPMILIAFDEMASLFQTKGNQREIVNLKNEITSYIEKIAQYGGSLSVFLFSSVQRPTVDFLPSFVKAMSNILISLKQVNSRSSEVATDDANLALGLKRRELVYNLDDWDYGLVPIVDNKYVYQCLKPSIKVNHRTIFDDLEKMNKRGKCQNKIDLEQVGTHFKSENEILQENISKIKDYVPYESPSGKILVKDETKIPVNTKKTFKKGKIKL